MIDKPTKALDVAVDELHAWFPGFHVSVEIYPAGGMLGVFGCEECGTEGFCQISWDSVRDKVYPATFAEAVGYIKAELSEKG